MSVSNYYILVLVGFGLGLLGIASGATLFQRAVVGNKKKSDGPGMSTLWGLFIVASAAGISLLAGLRVILLTRLFSLGLLILGGISGVSLFFRAAVGHEVTSEEAGIKTLWGLFIVGASAGVILLFATA